MSVVGAILRLVHSRVLAIHFQGERCKTCAVAHHHQKARMGAPEDEAPKEPVTVKAVEKPPSDWELPEEGTSRKFRIPIARRAAGWAIADRFDRLLPPHKRYLGRSRRTFLICVGVVFVVLLSLIIGLSVGLTRKSKYAHNLCFQYVC